MKNLLLVLIAMSFFSCASIPIAKKRDYDGISTEILYPAQGQRVHIATVDLSRAHLEIIESINGLKKTSTLAQSHHALIAINGGFFGVDEKPVGALKVNGMWKSYPTKLRGVIGFDDEHGVIFDRLAKHDVIVHDDTLQLAEDGWWHRYGNILGGAPLLLARGQIVTPEPEKTLTSFLNSRYARTAICQTKDRKLKLVVVDGGDRSANKWRTSKGMTIVELSQFLLTLGCEHALNLDGGYSSTFVENGKKLSHFSLNFLPERRVSTVVIVKPRQ